MSRALNTIGIIGRVSETLCDGQTVKTRILMDELRARYPKSEIFVAHTHDFKRHPLKRLRQVVQCLKRSDAIFVLLSRNGRRVIFPLLYWLNRFYHKPLFHDLIGGVLDEDLGREPGLLKQLHMFRVNWVETEGLLNRLTALGLKNGAVLPNFKRLEILSAQDLNVKTDEIWRFCTFSRVTESKGIAVAIQAVLAINQERGKQVACLDVYGPVEPPFDQKFERLLAESGDAVRYMGVADYRESTRILKDYDLLLFPTWHDGEGFPGTLVDAFSAGLPVIATDWHCNGEIITHGQTGYLYPVDQPHMLKLLMEKAMADPEDLHRMALNCLTEVQNYDAQTAMDEVCRSLREAMDA